MTIWHCVFKHHENLICKGTPGWEIEPSPMKNAEGQILFYNNGVCKLNPETCGKAKLEQSDARIQSGSLKMEIIPNIKEGTKEEVKKATGKKSKVNAQQGRLF